MEGIIYTESGRAYRGKGFGALATNVGELVFNTAMTGYQELLTDPAAMGQIINMTYPLIGNSGISEVDGESERVHAFGVVARDISFRPSNRLSVMSISDWLRKQGVPGVYGVDTRAIAKMVREHGTQKCLITTVGISNDYAQELLKKTALRADYMRDAGAPLRTLRKGSAAEGVTGRGLRIALLDFGVKKSAVKAFTDRGVDVLLCPYGTTAEEIMAMSPDGLVLPGGPGDPRECREGIEAAKGLLGKLPIFGICTGHLVLALAAGGKIQKLKFGHHGANHGVIDIARGTSAITSQGHSFAVDGESLKGTGMAVSHINLNDGTVEGLRHVSLPVFSVQFHPEGAAGPHDSLGLFGEFIAMMRAEGGSQVAVADCRTAMANTDRQEDGLQAAEGDLPMKGGGHA